MFLVVRKIISHTDSSIMTVIRNVLSLTNRKFLLVCLCCAIYRNKKTYHLIRHCPSLMARRTADDYERGRVYLEETEARFPTPCLGTRCVYGEPGCGHAIYRSRNPDDGNAVMSAVAGSSAGGGGRGRDSCGPCAWLCLAPPWLPLGSPLVCSREWSRGVLSACRVYCLMGEHVSRGCGATTFPEPLY